MTTTTQSAPSGTRTVGSTLILALGTFAVGTDAFVLAGFLPSMAAGLGISNAAAGASVTVFAISYALLAPVIASLTASLPRRSLLVGAMVLLAAANVASALSPNLTILLITRVVAAASAAAYTPNAGAVAASLVPTEQRGRALAVVIGGLTVATAIGVPLGNLLEAHLGWRSALGLVAALSALAALGLRLAMPDLPGQPAVPLARRLRPLRSGPVLRIVALTVLGMGACYTAYAYTVPALDDWGITGSTVTAMLVLYGVGAFAGNLASGTLTDRWGPGTVLLVAYVVMSACLFVAARALDTGFGGPALAGLVFALWGASSWAQTPAQQHRLIATVSDQAPVAVALNSSAIYLGIGLGTLVGGQALESSTSTMFVVGGVIAVIACLWLLLTRRDS